MFSRSKFNTSNTDPSTTSKSTISIPFRIFDKGKKKPIGSILNEDIVYLVLEHLYFDSHLRPDYKNLAKYALISRAWRDPVQRLLFHEVVIKDDVAYNSLSSTLTNRKTNRAQWLAGCVRVLNFWISKTAKTSAAKWEARLAPTLNLFPLLYELRLGVDVVDRLSRETMDALKTTPPIRALQIAMRPDENGKDAKNSVVPFQILGVTAWKLEFLVMRGEMFKVTSYAEFLPVKHELVEFRWSIPTDVSTAFTISKVITDVTANSLKTLEVLHIPNASHPIVTKVAPTLRSLKVTSRDSVPKKLRNLTELILADYKLLPYDLTFFAGLPPNITHLGIGCTELYQAPTYHSGRSLAPSYRFPVEALDHKLPSKLQTLSIYCESSSRTVTEYIREDFKLKNSGVHVRLFAPGVSSTIGMRSDLVRSTSFPREVSIQNMRRMGHVNDTDELST